MPAGTPRSGTSHRTGCSGPSTFPRRTAPYLPDVWVSPDGRQAATIRDAGGSIMFDPVTRRVLRHLTSLPGDESAAFNIAVQGWTPDGRSLLVTRQLSTTDSDLLVVDGTTGAVTLHVGTGQAWAAAVAEDPTGRFIALAMNDGMLQVLDAKDGHALAPPLRANDGALNNVSISPDGRYIAASGDPPT